VRIAAYANRFVISVPLDEMEVLRAVVDIGIAELKDSRKLRAFRKGLTPAEKKAFTRWVWKNPLKVITRDATDYRQPPTKKRA
jgi:hypothetical protein